MDFKKIVEERSDLLGLSGYLTKWDKIREAQLSLVLPLKCDHCSREIIQLGEGTSRVWSPDVIVKILLKQQGIKIYCGQGNHCSQARKEFVAEVKATPMYCQCGVCLEKGQVEETRIPTESYIDKTILTHLDRYYLKGTPPLQYIQGHPYARKPLKIKEPKPPTKKDLDRLARVQKILAGQVFRSYDMDSSGKLRDGPVYPRWCEGCGKVTWHTPSHVHSYQQSKLTFCFECHGISRRRLCECGQPKRKRKNGKPGFEARCRKCENKYKHQIKERKFKLNRTIEFVKQVEDLCQQKQQP